MAYPRRFECLQSVAAQSSYYPQRLPLGRIARSCPPSCSFAIVPTSHALCALVLQLKLVAERVEFAPQGRDELLVGIDADVTRRAIRVIAVEVDALVAADEQLPLHLALVIVVHAEQERAYMARHIVGALDLDQLAAVVQGNDGVRGSAVAPPVLGHEAPRQRGEPALDLQ